MLKITNKKAFVFLALSIVMILTTYRLWQRTGYDRFQFDSEAFALSMIDAGKYDFDISSKKFGLGRLTLPDGEIVPREVTYDIYYNYDSIDYTVNEYDSQIGFHGWVFYYLTKIGIPHPFSAFRLGCCLAFSIVFVLICYELYKKYGVLLSGVFYIVSISSTFLIRFSPNLYWVIFTMFIPMFLGLVCLNNLNKRLWLYPMIFLANLINYVCGYEYVPVIMLSSIMFLIVDWICTLKIDKPHSILVFKAIIGVGTMSALGFLVAIIIHSYLAGHGDILNGLNHIRLTAFRRSIGIEGSTSIKTSVFDVLRMYLSWNANAEGKKAFFLLITTTVILIIKRKGCPLLQNAELWLFSVSFSTCISWTILAKDHSYNHIHVNHVTWYMGYMQISVYIVLKFVLQQLLKIDVFSNVKIIKKLL